MIVVSQDGKTVFPLEQVMLGTRKGWGEFHCPKYEIVLYPLGANPLTEDPTVIADFTKEEDAEDALMTLVDCYGKDKRVFYMALFWSEENNG